jgi:hypothetical protein
MQLQPGKYFESFFFNLRDHFIAYCRFSEAMKLFRFLLSPCSLIGQCAELLFS